MKRRVMVLSSSHLGYDFERIHPPQELAFENRYKTATLERSFCRDKAHYW